MNCFKFLVAFVFCLIPGYIFSQTVVADSILLEDKVVIEGQRLEEYAVGVSVQQLDSEKISIYKSQSISNLLSRETGVTIKSYGIGGLSTPSIRGGNGSHTPILWNGINLQNSMNGNASLSLIPATFFDQVKVQYGGGSTLFGSGLVSGAIHINNSSLSSQKDRVVVNAGIGSFGDKTASSIIKEQFGQLHSELRLFYREAKNDFEYTNNAKFGHPKERQTNAEFDAFGITQSNELKLGNIGYLATSLWYNHYDKNLQSLMIQDTSMSNQVDNSVRANVSYFNAHPKNPLKIKSAILYDELLYTNPTLGDPTSNHYTKSWISEAEKRFTFSSNHKVDLGLNYTYEQAESDGLSDKVVRNRIAVFGSYRIKNIIPNFNSSLNIRQEMVDSQLIPTVLSAGFDYLAFPFLMIKGNASKNYRLPTFNDLYWRTDTDSSGNPDLKPESGYNIALGMTEFINGDYLSITFGQDYYWTKTNNWIVWLPNENGQWTPDNKDIGESYGAEINFKAEAKLTHLKLFSDGFFKYSIATLTEKETASTKQNAWYEPKYSFRGTIGMNYQKLTFSYNHNYFGARYYDNKNKLDPYQIGSIYLGYQYPFNKNYLNLSLNINNVWNEDYQVVAWYAMPPVNYQLNISYQFNL